MSHGKHGGIRYSYVCHACGDAGGEECAAKVERCPRLHDGWASVSLTLMGIADATQADQILDALESQDLPDSIKASQRTYVLAMLRSGVIPPAPPRRFEVVLCPKCQTGPLFDAVSEQLEPTPDVNITLPPFQLKP